MPGQLDNEPPPAQRARDGTLPPVLALYLQVLGKYLILDGHDRAHAALIEGIDPPLCVLWPARARDVTTTDVAGLEKLHELSAAQPELPWPGMLNASAERIYHWRSTHYATLRGYPFFGGERAWHDEVSRRLESLRGDVDPVDVALCLEP